jgi:CheY-like chemotaxis protein
MPNGSAPHILVVDDEPSVRECLGILLTSAGYNVALAESGLSAVLHLNTAMPDLIVTDLNMPQMSGMELISHVRSRYPSIAIVAMSGEYHRNAVPAGLIADRFYPKGQHPHHLLTAIATLIANSPHRESAQENRTQPKLHS